MSARTRCSWAGDDPLMQAYHDREWGVPQRDPRALWEMLMLEGFQAGLSWAIVLRKRDAFRKAFARFDPNSGRPIHRARRQSTDDDPEIIRARAKIEATVTGARIFCEMCDRGEDFADFCWSFSDGQVVTGDGPIVSDPDGALRDDLEGTEAPRLQVRGADDRLRLDAGRRHRQRPFHQLLSTRSGRTPEMRRANRRVLREFRCRPLRSVRSRERRVFACRT